MSAGARPHTQAPPSLLPDHATLAPSGSFRHQSLLGPQGAAVAFLTVVERRSRASWGLGAGRGPVRIRCAWRARRLQRTPRRAGASRSREAAKLVPLDSPASGQKEVRPPSLRVSVSLVSADARASAGKIVPHPPTGRALYLKVRCKRQLLAACFECKKAKHGRARECYCASLQGEVGIPRDTTAAAKSKPPRLSRRGNCA